MIKKIEHIGIAVNSIDDALPVFEALFNKKAYKTEIVESEFVKTAFIKAIIITYLNKDFFLSKALQRMDLPNS